MRKKFILLILFIICYIITYAQQAGWMLGTWKSRSEAITPSANVTNTIKINDVSSESFTGTKTTETNNGKITIAISGAFRARGLYLQNGEVLHKEPETSQWNDCSACAQSNKMIIRGDSLVLIDSISNCNNACDAVTFYYRLLFEYDDDTQRYLVDRFGRPSDIIGFHPYSPPESKAVASNDDTELSKNNVAADARLINEKRLQHINDSTRIAQQRKREQETSDSLNLVQKKEQRRLKDSLDNASRQIQQQIEDSTLLAHQKMREQKTADSLNLVKQKEQQRIKDSLDNVARLQQIKRRTEDSIQNVQLKKRQLEVADSLSLAGQIKQQHIKDSLQREAAANLQKQQTEDSLLNVQARIRQQEITDSVAAVRRQQVNDSLQKSALAKAVPPAATDSNHSAANNALTSRTSTLLGSYHITSPDILIELFDNGEIDGDRVSVYHNNAIVVSNQTLGIKPITLNIHADATNREHEFVLVAENLGSIPPNSALMRVTAGKQVYKLSVNTDMKTNARIVFIYDGN